MNGSSWKQNNHFAYFNASLSLRANHIAVFDSEYSYSYQDLFTHARSLAEDLRKQGISKDTTVAVCLKRSANWVIALLAIWEAGATYVPFDSQLPTERIKYMLDSAGVSIVVVDDHTTEIITGLAALINVKHSMLKTVASMSTTMLIGAAVNDNDRAYIIFTSGTTGYPKGVQIDHANVTNMVMEHMISGEIKSEDRVALCASLGFDASLRDIVGALATGATLYIVSQEELELSTFCKMLADRQITYAVVMPALLAAIGAPPLLPDLSTIVVAGEAPTHETIRAWGSGRLLINAYGPTEVTVCATKRLYPNGIITPNQPVSIGCPTFGVSALVLDEKLVPVSVGNLGELYLGGASVSQRGYLNNEDMNSWKFVDIPVLGGRAYRTGDKCRVLLGNELEWVERLDDQIKINGFRIESSEVRASITRLPNVADCIVRPWQVEKRTYLVAYIVLIKDSNVSRDNFRTHQIRDAIRDHLPYYAIPSFVIEIDHIPLTINGKVDIGRLPIPDVASAPDTAPAGITGLEAQLWEIWFEVMPKELASAFSSETRFQEGGGGSLEAQIILHRIAQRWHRSITYRQFLEGGGTIRWTANLLQISLDESSPTQNLGAPFEENTDFLKYARQSSPHLQLTDTAPSASSGRRRWLLTGATGFLGAHLLASLVRLGIQVTCIVREERSMSAQMRLGERLSRYGISPNILEKNVKAVSGDILQEGLGLSRENYRELSENLDAIIHCAADVNFIKTYDQLADTNVRGTAEVLRFAVAGRTKKFCHVSSLAVFFSAEAAAAEQGEESAAAFSRGILGGYAQSKWVSEQIVWDASMKGLDVTVFRPARLWSDVQLLKHHEQDLYVRLLRFIAITRQAPDIDFAMDFTLVSTAADVIVQLALEAPSDCYHILDERTVHLQQIVDWVNATGRQIERVSYPRWLRLVDSEVGVRSLGPLVSIFRDRINEHGSLFDNLLRLPCYASGIFPNEKASKALREPLPFTRLETPKMYIEQCFEAWWALENHTGMTEAR